MPAMTFKLLLPLPQTKEADGSCILIVRCENVDPSKISFINVVKTSLMILDILFNEDDNFVVAGQIGLVNLNGMSLGHAVQITPNVCKKIIKCLQDCYPSRPQVLLFINTPTFFKRIFRLMRRFLRTKAINRIYNGKNIENIHKHIPLSILPKEYDGEGISLQDLTVEWKRKVESYKDWFLEDGKYCSDETKRIGEPLTSDCMFGMAGSFRQFDFD